MKKITCLAGALLLLAYSEAVAPQSLKDYPQWRGRNRDGAASEFFEPKSWPEKLTLRWKVTVGEGYATPIVVGNTVYSFTRRDGKEVLMALKATSGKILWQTSYSAPYTVASPAAAHGAGPKATPLFHDGRLYTLGISGIMSAFDAATGKLVWQTPAASEQPYFGMAVSPIGDKELVIGNAGNYGPLTAFDEGTGHIKWTADGDSAWASPIIVELGGTRQVISMTTKSVISISVANGELLWEYPWVSTRTASAITPLVYGETIIVGSQGMAVTELRPTRRNGKWEVDTLWENQDVSLFLSNPVIVRDTLFGLSERASGQFFALDARTGKVLWLGPPREASNTAVVKANELLFLLNDDAELIVARSSRKGFEPLKKYDVADSATWAQPTISGNRIFVKDVSSLTLWTVN